MASVKSKEAFEQFNKGLIEMVSSDDKFVAWLDQMAAVGPTTTRRFSLMNQLWLMIQGASGYAATYKRWKGLNRQVGKGRKAVHVYRPIKIASKGEGGDAGQVTTEGGIRLVGFSVIPQFRIEDTFEVDENGKAKYTDANGQPLYGLVHKPNPPVDIGDEVDDWTHLLTDFQKKLNVTIEFDTEHMEDSCYGFFDPQRNKIVLKTLGRKNGAVLHTLFHELGHKILHRNMNFEHTSRSIEEMEAESVAAVCSKTLAIDSSGFSFSYVACWAGVPAPELSKKVRESGDRILSAVNAIMEVVDPQGSKDAKNIDKE